MIKRWNLEIAEQHITAQASSGLTKKDYCASRGIKASTFYYWQNRLASSEGQVAGFTPVKIQQSTELEVQLNDGRWLGLRSSDSSVLAEVLIKIAQSDA